jgi:peptide subunit release factor 1 (eRF1)
VPASNNVTEETLKGLAAIKADGETVLSLYLDLDPAHFATAPARVSEIDSLLDRAHREIESGERPHAELMALRAALERAREILTGGPRVPETPQLPRDQPWAEGARAIALFICTPLALEQLLRLPHPMNSTVVLSDAPFIAPLAESGPTGRVCVALVDERFARILRGSADALGELVSFGDPVHGRQDQGGWSQARYQRSQHEDVDSHLRHVARVLHDLLNVSPYDRLLVACTEPLWPRVVGKLHPEVRRRMHEERLVLDVGDVGIEDVVRAARQVLEAEHRQHLSAVLAELQERHARPADGRAAVGLEDVLLALVERRVEVLLYEPGLKASGIVCPRDRWMGVEGESCPIDGGPVERRANILEDAVQSALGQSAEVLPVGERAELGPFGGIAATLRF